MRRRFAFIDPDLGVRFRYADPTPQGFKIRFAEKVQPTGRRMHLTSPGSHEIYFEVARYPEIEIKAAFDLFRQGLPVEEMALEISGPETATVSGRTAQKYSIIWPEKSRWVYFVKNKGGTYRVILDPESLLNRDLLDTLKFI